MIKLFSFILLFSITFRAEGQKKNAAYQKYIEKYSRLAVVNQQQYKIPASITLAQALLESNAEQSDLAKKSNNQFGIKCHEWTGDKVYHNDDKKGECFRKYKNVEASYNDHGRFLTERPRYAPLFKLNIKDYKGWARGLQKCGYATSNSYANRLIKLIEDYELYRYDSGITPPKTVKQPKQPKKPVTPAVKRSVYKANGLMYVYAHSNDTFNKIASETGVKASWLQKFNEIPDGYPLQKGDIVYLEKKKNKADKPNYDHVVQIAESMHSISQRYGIQIKSLYKINNKKYDYIPEEGDMLRLR